MNFVSDKGAQALVYELVARNRPQALESVGNDDCLKMGVVVAHYRGGSVFEAGLDELLDFAWFHRRAIT